MLAGLHSGSEIIPVGVAVNWSLVGGCEAWEWQQFSQQASSVAWFWAMLLEAES